MRFFIVTQANPFSIYRQSCLNKSPLRLFISSTKLKLISQPLNPRSIDSMKLKKLEINEKCIWIFNEALNYINEALN